ncbi:MAG: hypothetical protein ABH843_05990 [Candidatus Omnitrophota bacterium]
MHFLLRKYAVTLLIITVFFGTGIFLYIYAGQGRFVKILKQNLEKSLSEAIGADVTIGSAKGNLLNRIILQDLRCGIKEYDISFREARLEYSFFDIIFSKKIAEEKEINIALELSGGLLKLNNGPVICDSISGKARFTPDKAVLEGLAFKFLGLIDTYVEGEFISRHKEQAVDLLFNFKPFFDKKDLLFDRLDLRLKGRLDNLSIYARMNRKQGLGLFLDGYLLFSEKVINIGSKIFLQDPKTQARYDILMDTEVDLEGLSFDTVIIPEEGKVSIHGDYSKWPELIIDVENRHIKIYGFDLSNIVHIISKIAFKERNFSHFTLDLNTESSVFNYYPLDEIEASFWVDKDILRIIYMKVGDAISASGALTIREPVKIVLNTTLSDFDINRVLAFTLKNNTPAISCKMSGDLFLEGPLNRLATKANLEAGEGYLGNIDYENMILNLKGMGPILRIYESRLVRKDSFLVIDGTVDMRRLGKSRFMEDIKVSTDEKTIIWEGWDISKSGDSGELTLSKGVDGGVKVEFKTHISEDETTYQPVKAQDELNIEYGMADEEVALQIKAKEKEDFFGIMKKYKF